MMLILEHTSNFHFLSTKPFEEKLHTLLKKGGLDQIFVQCVPEQKQKTKRILINIPMVGIKRNLPMS